MFTLLKKTTLTLTVCAFACTAVSCTKKADTTVSLPQSFTLTAEICDNDFTSSADMKRTTDGWEITLNSPETLEGMTVTVAENDLNISYQDLSYNVTVDEIPNASPLLLTVRALDKCVNSKTSGTLCGEEYSVTFSGNKPQSLKIGEITVEFSDYKI